MNNKPEMIPKDGYTETIDANGDHVYTPTPETVKRNELEKNLGILQETINVLLGVIE